MGMASPFDRQRNNHARGRAGEDEAARWLERQGFQILERNFSGRSGEIDLIAFEGQTLCFLEVKARSGPGFGPALAAVGRTKQHRLSRTAVLFMALRHLERRPCRFDVLGLDWADGAWRFSLVRNAFPFCP
jgi:putative endonuclease